jgi:prophage tail gpP-like protein
MSENVRLFIGEDELAWHTDLDFTVAVDAIPLVNYTAPFDPESKVLRDMFRPFSYREVSLLVDGAREFTGTQNEINPRRTATDTQVAAGAYSKPGVLAECCPAAGNLPLDFRGVGLREIAEKLAEPFGIKVVIVGDTGADFKKLKIDPTATVLDTLVKLAREKNFVITANALGDLVFQRANPLGIPVADLAEGARPLESITPTFRASEVYSELTGLRTVRVRSKVSDRVTVFPKITEAYRPYTFSVDKAEDTAAAANAAGSRMAAGAVSYTAEVTTWRDEHGDLWRPNTAIQLYAPSVFIYRSFTFQIRTVKFMRRAEEERAALELVLPGAFVEQVQTEGVPWEDWL